MKNMTTRISILGVVFLSLLFSSCSKDDDAPELLPDPVASFELEAAPDNPQLISFLNTSENAEEFFWEFGDETQASTQKHPTHLYSSGGTYTVKLTATLGENVTSTSREITVTGTPLADFTYEVDAENSYTVHFTNLSQNVNSYSWDFGDQVGTSTDQQPTYTYAEAGSYTVTLTATGDGGTSEKVLQVEVTDPQPSFDSLYIIGDASESGWNIASPAAFEQDQANPFRFTYHGILTPGNLKFSTFTGDWCDGKWLNAPENALPATGTTGYIVTNGCEGPDNQWNVTAQTQGRYTITVDLEEKTVLFEKHTPAYSELYAIGDAVPNGWIPQTPSEGFIQDGTDPFLFTYEVYLSPGELKIATFAGEWCDGDWINAPVPDADIATASEFIVTKGCDGPDNKWRITSETEGNYVIRINLYEENISFIKQ